MNRGNDAPGGMSPGVTRFVVLVGILFFGMRCRASYLILAVANDEAGEGGIDPARRRLVGDEPRTAVTGEMANLGRKRAEALANAPRIPARGNREVRVLPREVAGWLLILRSYSRSAPTICSFEQTHLEATPMVFIGFIVFRGGIHVLKVAVAAQAARNLPETAQPGARRINRPATRPVGPTPASAVLPGRRSARG